MCIRDSSITVSVAEWPLHSNFDEDPSSGPVPRLFADVPDVARAALVADPQRAHKDLQRILAKFFVPENMAPHKAWEYVRRPR